MYDYGGTEWWPAVVLTERSELEARDADHKIWALAPIKNNAVSYIVKILGMPEARLDCLIAAHGGTG